MRLQDKIKFWYRALVLTYPYFRITYKDGGMSKPLLLGQAFYIFLREPCSLWADYDLMRDI